MRRWKQVFKEANNRTITIATPPKKLAARHFFQEIATTLQSTTKKRNDSLEPRNPNLNARRCTLDKLRLDIDRRVR